MTKCRKTKDFHVNVQSNRRKLSQNEKKINHKIINYKNSLSLQSGYMLSPKIMRGRQILACLASNAHQKMNSLASLDAEKLLPCKVK